MEALFLTVLNMSITAGWLILAVAVLRLLLKRSPKWLACALWSLVAMRLVCPFTPESALSLIPSAQTVSPDIIYAKTPEIHSGVNAFDNVVNPALNQAFAPDVTSSANPLQIVSFAFARLWVIGMAVMFAYALISWLRLRKKVQTATPLKENIWICDEIATPFTFGIFKPRIYLPSDTAAEEADYVIAHEISHLKRHDNFWKPLGFTLLCVHWFNPLCWIAYALFCKDTELACDEKTVKNLDAHSKKAYSEALLSFSTNCRTVAACPFAFGEGNVKQRIKTVLNYKRPALWLIIVAVVVCITVTACFMTNPSGSKITQLSEVGGNILNNVKSVYVVSGSGEHEFSSADDVAEIIKNVSDIRLDRSEISKNRSEGRDKTNTVVLYYKDGKTDISINFNNECTEMWINGSLKPTFSYRVRNPETIKPLFGSIEPVTIIEPPQGNDDGEEAVIPQKVQPSIVPQTFLPNIVIENYYGNPSYSAVVCYGAENETAWEYKTPEYQLSELEPVTEIGVYGDSYLFNEAGTIVALDTATGEVKWKNEDFGGRSAAAIIDENGNVYACGYYTPDFYMLDASGKTVKKIETFDSDYFWSESIFKDGNTVKVVMTQGPNGEGSFIFTVDLTDFDVSAAF